MLPTNWREVISDPQQRRVFEALEDPSWEWRTVDALAKVSGLSEDQVVALVNRHPTLVRKSLVPSEDGRDLYTLQSRHFERQNPMQKGWNFLSSSSSSSSSS